ncbi:hypothetical protein HII36_47220 [Nonomuraea sp. NN258]|uniref:hypothetical protein n=1 Tax=Nonomuraea antri TaxID=2730852 RepID=UPI00156965A4|nr:hypothetical protein [Nonomuraea antri]NRQ39366.1 hypothetical protein [Nonomuraea antri]
MIAPAYRRTTRLCPIDDLDVPLQVLIDGFAERHLLGDLRASARICAETHSVPLPRPGRGPLGGPGFAPMAVENRAAAVVTDTFVVIALVRVDGESVRLAGQLADATLRTPDPGLYGPEPGVFVHAGWLGHGEASSYLLPLDEGPDGRVFLSRLRDLIAAARVRR